MANRVEVLGGEEPGEVVLAIRSEAERDQRATVDAASHITSVAAAAGLQVTIQGGAAGAAPEEG